MAGVRGAFVARARSGGRGVATRVAPGFLLGVGGSRGVARIFRIGFPGLLRVRIFRAGIAWFGLLLLLKRYDPLLPSAAESTSLPSVCNPVSDWLYDAVPVALVAFAVVTAAELLELAGVPLASS